MSLEATLDGDPVDVTSIRLRGDGSQGVSMALAADGSMSSGGIVFDDPAGTLPIEGWEYVTVEEPDCTAAPRLFTGTIAESTERRGKYRNGPAREIDATINDQNIFLALRLIDGVDGKRPSETSAERLDWLLGSTYLSGLVYDLGLINPANLGTLVYDANDYRGQYPNEVLASLCGPRQEIFFAYWDQDEEKVGLFFDIPTATAFTSSLTISNVLSDVDDSTCFAPWTDGERLSDPSTIYSSVRLVYSTGVINRFDGTTGVTWFPAPLLRRGVNIEIPGIGKLATANIWAARILAGASTPAVSVTCTVRLPSTHVGLIQPGHRISVRFSHLTGFHSFTYTRVERMTIVQADNRRDFYDVGLVLSTSGLLGTGGSPGGTDPFPQPPAGPPSLVQSAIRIDGSTFSPTPGTPIDGNLLLAWMVERSASAYPPTPTGWTSVTTVFNDSTPFPGPNGARLVSKIASGDTPTSIENDFTLSGVGTTFMEWNATAIDAFVAASDVNSNNASTVMNSGGAITPAAAGAIVVGCAIVGTAGECYVAPDAGVTEIADFPFPGSNNPNNWVGYRTVTTPVSTTVGGTMNPANRKEYGGVTFTLLPSAASDPPTPAKRFGPITPVETPDGATYTFTLPEPFEFADFSLEVFVNRLDQTAAVTSYDGATRTFTLAFAPWGTDTIEVYGQGL